MSPRSCRVEGLLQARPARVPSPRRKSRPSGVQRSACTPAALCLLCLMMALPLLLWSAQHWSSELVATSLPSISDALLAAFFLPLRFAHQSICQQMYHAAQPSRGICPTMCHSMPEPRCYHMQGKAAQTKRGPAPRAVAPVKVNAKPAIRQSATSTGAVQVGQSAVRQWCHCMPSGSSRLPCTALSNIPR